MEGLTSVTINITDGSVICACTVLAERLATIALFSWNSEERDSLWSDIYREAAALGVPPRPELETWFSINAKLTSLWATRISQLFRFPQWIMVGRELQNRALPWSELCYTKSISPILQEKRYYLFIRCWSHSRPMYWISIRISFVLFWKLLNHAAASKNLPFQSMNCCYFCRIDLRGFGKCTGRVPVSKRDRVHKCFSLLSILKLGFPEYECTGCGGALVQFLMQVISHVS